VSEIENRLHELLNGFAKANDFEIISMNGEEDHVHLLISATPNTIIPNIIKGMKGITAKMLIKEFPEIKDKLYGGHMWSPSYFICTVSENTEENIKKYIESQKDK
jgi:putative transposase